MFRTRIPSIPLLFAAALITLAGTPPAARAQDAKKVLTVPDYSRWRTVGDETISSDGRWVAWVYRFTNVARDDEKPELHILNLATNRDTAITNASSPVFSP
ncbi:MAG: hypothetical protein P8174_11355, partial [Gemmatimonadota bacterium]